jgi:hypothetical protein
MLKESCNEFGELEGDGVGIAMMIEDDIMNKQQNIDVELIIEDDPMNMDMMIEDATMKKQ